MLGFFCITAYPSCRPPSPRPVCGKRERQRSAPALIATVAHSAHAVGATFTCARQLSVGKRSWLVCAVSLCYRRGKGLNAAVPASTLTLPSSAFSCLASCGFRITCKLSPLSWPSATLCKSHEASLRAEAQASSGHLRCRHQPNQAPPCSPSRAARGCGSCPGGWERRGARLMPSTAKD